MSLVALKRGAGAICKCTATRCPCWIVFLLKRVELCKVAAPPRRVHLNRYPQH